MRVVLAAALAAVLVSSCGQRDVPAGGRVIDLSHAFGPSTIYWPTSPSAFTLETLAHGHTDGGFFYSAYRLSTPEHGGTHLDAPIHFAEGRRTVDQIPIEQLVGHAVVLDVSAQASRDRDYRLTVDDVLAFEREHGRVPDRAIVLLRTGWSRYWPSARDYLGDDTPGDASKLSFPSYGEEAARLSWRSGAPGCSAWTPRRSTSAARPTSSSIGSPRRVTCLDWRPSPTSSSCPPPAQRSWHCR
ncbi:hypothetical protein BH23ACI1_BH23ACI1_32560 [soil metagenome]